MNKTDDGQPEPELLEQSEAASNPEIARITAEVTHQVITRVSKYFSGPLPPPDILAEYNEAAPNGADRILVMAESQLKHRQSLEAKVVDSNCSNERLGIIIGASIALITIVGGIALAFYDKPLSGFSLIIVNLAALVSVFVYSRQSQTKERKEKIKPIKETLNPNPDPS